MDKSTAELEQTYSSRIICLLCEENCHGTVFYVDGDAVCEDCYREEVVACDICRQDVFFLDCYTDQCLTVCADCFKKHLDICPGCKKLVFVAEARIHKKQKFCENCFPV